MRQFASRSGEMTCGICVGFGTQDATRVVSDSLQVSMQLCQKAVAPGMERLQRALWDGENLFSQWVLPESK